MRPGSIDNWQSTALFGFRAAVLGQTVAIAAQAVLAGLALSGYSTALAAHMMVGGFALFISVVQVALALLLEREVRREALVASAGLLIGEGVQMASGRLHLFAVHLPLGVALFAGAVMLSLWAMDVVPACDCPPSRVTVGRWAGSSIGDEL
jgi:hypothetical protein